MPRTVKDYKQSLKYANERAEEKQKWGEKWQNYAWDLQAKLDTALDRLQTIAEGRYYTHESDGSASNKDQITAAIALKKVARMQERKP